MVDLNLKTLVNARGCTYLISTVNLLIKKAGELDFQTLVLESSEFQDENTVGGSSINYDVIDWVNPIESHSWKTLDEAKTNHKEIVEKYRRQRGFCGVK